MNQLPSRNPTLLIFTDSYPDDLAREHTFIGLQLPFLLEAFERVILVPSRHGGKRTPVPRGVTVDDSLAQQLGDRRQVAAQGLRSRLAFLDFVKRPSLGLSVRGIRRLVAMAGRAEVTCSWVEGWLGRHGLRADDCVGYSFWWNHAAIGLALARSHDRRLVAVTRAHGVDLFEERHTPAYLPLRHFSVENLDRVYFASDAGRDYVGGRHPRFARRYEVARLGTADPGFRSPESRGPDVVLVSCSAMIPIKRVDLVARGIAKAAVDRPAVRFVWHHFGARDGANAVHREVALLPTNVEARLYGERPQDEILMFYRDHAIDAFVNASASEGGSPVAIMEAASCGIPVVATSVGGNPEIVSERNGVLVSANPSPGEIGAALIGLLDRPELWNRKRLESRRVWEERFSAEANYSEFAKSLARLRSARREGRS